MSIPVRERHAGESSAFVWVAITISSIIVAGIGGLLLVSISTAIDETALYHIHYSAFHIYYGAMIGIVVYVVVDNLLRKLNKVTVFDFVTILQLHKEVKELCVKLKEYDENTFPVLSVASLAPVTASNNTAAAGIAGADFAAASTFADDSIVLHPLVMVAAPFFIVYATIANLLCGLIHLVAHTLNLYKKAIAKKGEIKDHIVGLKAKSKTIAMADAFWLIIYAPSSMLVCGLINLVTHALSPFEETSLFEETNAKTEIKDTIVA